MRCKIGKDDEQVRYQIREERHGIHPIEKHGSLKGTGAKPSVFVFTLGNNGRRNWPGNAERSRVS